MDTSEKESADSSSQGKLIERAREQTEEVRRILNEASGRAEAETSPGNPGVGDVQRLLERLRLERRVRQSENGMTKERGSFVQGE